MIESIIIVILGVTALFIALLNARHRVEDAKVRLAQLKKLKRSQVQRLRKVAYRSMTLKRTLIKQHGRGQDTKAEMEQIEGDIRRASDPANRIYILEERRTALETAWIASVTANSGTDAVLAFPGTRRHVLWGTDEASVRARLGRRFPAESGFVIGAVGPYQMPVPPAVDAKTAKATAGA
jgi:hypothetical protein